jgi:hypothetical protein
MRANGEDQQGEHFLREWLGDLAAVQDAGEDAQILRYPPEAMLERLRTGQ